MLPCKSLWEPYRTQIVKIIIIIIVRFRLTSWRDFGDLRYSLPTSLGQCIYMSRGLANELLVT